MRNSKNMLSQASDKLSLSPRSYFKIIRVARTIADLDNSAKYKLHISQKLSNTDNELDLLSVICYHVQRV